MGLNKLLGLVSLLSLATLACEPRQGGPDSQPSTPVSAGIDRSSLPIREPARTSYTELDVRNATPPPRFEVKAYTGAPNVVVILIDDMGFGVSQPFGGPARMPTMDRLAQNGLRHNRFHTTALCAPTRMALLTGYNHHSANMGVITELASTYAGYKAVRPQTITPVAEVRGGTDTTPPSSASAMKCRRGRFRTTARRTVGLPAPTLRNSTAFLEVKPTSGPCSSTTGLP